MARKSGRFSIIPARALDDPRLGKAALIVLCALGTYSNRDGWCWPKRDTLADRLHVTVRQISYSLQQLKKLGYIEVKARFDDSGRQQPNGYRVLHDADLPAELLDPGEGEAELQGGVKSSFTPRGEVQLQGEGEVQLHPERTKVERPIERTNDSSPAGRFEEFWQTYPSRCPHSNPEKPARAKFEAALKRGVAPADIIRGAENYAAYIRREQPDPKFVAQAQTWLNQERWTEYQEAVEDDPRPLML